MIYYLNSVKKYYNTKVKDSEEMSASSDSEEDIGESNRDLKLKKKDEFKFSLNNLKIFLAVAPKMCEIEQGIEVLADNGGQEFT